MTKAEAIQACVDYPDQAHLDPVSEALSSMALRGIKAGASRLELTLLGRDEADAILTEKAALFFIETGLAAGLLSFKNGPLRCIRRGDAVLLVMERRP